MAAGMNILIVDDEKPIAALLAQSFTQEGHRVDEAKDGIDCMNKMATFMPDVVIMDIMMPVMNGHEAMIKIRKSDVYGEVPIIALTAMASAGDREKCLEAGANAFIAKPLEIEKLTSLMADLFGEYKAVLA